MRVSAIALGGLFLAVSLSGCLVDMMASTAIQGGLQAEQMSTYQKTLEDVKGTTSDLEISKAIQAYQAEHGKNPSSLQDLVPSYFTVLPTKADGSQYAYDPASGRLLDRPAAAMTAASAGGGPSEQVKLQQVRDAIGKFAGATGFYPGNLQQLVPVYMATLPKDSSGRDFAYDPSTGTVSTGVPAGAARQVLSGQPPQQHRGAGGGGVGPLGETMTGIGISNQLDNMSSAGSSAVSSRVRGDARGIGQEHDQRQQQTMDNLGL
ncbi:MAG: hypothetical protein WC655_05295 [Candidatus Hydrogenedentales bacterium]|jgi:hypothetical protein